MAGVGLELAECGMTPNSVVDAVLKGGWDPAAVKLELFNLFYKATSIAAKAGRCRITL